jgi:hypothetical protein
VSVAVTKKNNQQLLLTISNAKHSTIIGKLTGASAQHVIRRNSSAGYEIVQSAGTVTLAIVRSFVDGKFPS